jgi:hypothetical protein
MRHQTTVYLSTVSAHTMPGVTLAETLARVPRKRLELRARVRRRQERRALWTLRLTTGRDWLGQVFGSRHPYRRVRRP